jgi:hypothetical protein
MSTWKWSFLIFFTTIATHSQCQVFAVSVSNRVHLNLCAMLSETYQEHCCVWTMRRQWQWVKIDVNSSIRCNKDRWLEYFPVSSIWSMVEKIKGLTTSVSLKILKVHEKIQLRAMKMKWSIQFVELRKDIPNDTSVTHMDGESSSDFCLSAFRILHSNLEQAQTQLGPYKDLYLCDSQCMPPSM